VAAGHFGAKTGKGFHSYAPKKLAAKQSERDEKFIALLKMFYSRNGATKEK
jgi:3-hydroxyacyl-CoA dehydrogenase